MEFEPIFATYAALPVAAVLPIYFGSHASLPKVFSDPRAPTCHDSFLGQSLRSCQVQEEQARRVV